MDPGVLQPPDLTDKPGLIDGALVWQSDIKPGENDQWAACR